MSSTLPVFTPIEDSLFLTLCGRAPDNQLPRPILGDPMAEQVVGELGYDCRHPDAVGLDLGAGLDTRVFRLDPPATSRAASWPSTAIPGSPSGRPGTTTAPSRWPT
jgi:O-methyltransferase involved in polyketide biosynthesis